MFHFASPPPLSLYVHVPWCVRKCPYCDFNSHALREALPENAYIDALLADLDHECARVVGRPVESVFIGGGTPSLLSPQAVERLLNGLSARLTLRPDLEITLEANPGTFEQAKFTAFRALGINRLSIGVQSFNDTLLKRLGRIHGREEAVRAVAMARRAGFDNLNIDLMFALPGQSLSDCLRDLETAIELDPDHLSFYQLTIEPNTAFHRRPPPLPDDDVAWAMQEEGGCRLADVGYNQYEVSAYARDGRWCRHNMNYWQFGDYLGIGAGAHGKLSVAQAISRRSKHRQPRQYLKAADGGAVSGESRLAEADAAFEFMLNALRLTRGFETPLFERRTGLSLAAIRPELESAVQDDLVAFDPTRIAPTALGRRFLNDLIARFLPA